MTKFSINEMAEPQCLGENSDLLVDLYHEIGIGAVKAALAVMATPGNVANPDESVALPPLLEDDHLAA